MGLSSPRPPPPSSAIRFRLGNYTLKNEHARPKQQGAELASRPCQTHVMSAEFEFESGFNTADHLTISLSTSFFSDSGVRSSFFGITLPRSSRRLRTPSSSSALTTAAFSLAAIGAGVP